MIIVKAIKQNKKSLQKVRHLNDLKLSIKWFIIDFKKEKKEYWQEKDVVTLKNYHVASWEKGAMIKGWIKHMVNYWLEVASWVN